MVCFGMKYRDTFLDTSTKPCRRVKIMYIQQSILQRINIIHKVTRDLTEDREDVDKLLLNYKIPRSR